MTGRYQFVGRNHQHVGKRFTRLLAALIGASLVASVARADFDTISEIEPPATARWSASGGQTSLRFDPGLMANFKLSVTGSEALRSASQPGDHRLDVSPLSKLDVWAPAAAFDGFASGELVHIGNLNLEYPGGTISLSNFTLRPVSASVLELVTESGETLFYLEYIHAMVDPQSETMTLWNMDLSISPDLAARLGDPAASGMVIGQVFSRTALDIPAGAQTQGVCTSPNWQDGVDFITDVELFNIGGVQQVAREANVRVAIAPSASLRNAGTADVPWYAKFSTPAAGTYPEPYDRDQHPFLVWALYREANGLFEQIGLSQVKHAFLTLNTVCSCSGGHILWSADSSANGLACEDVYGVGTNDNPSNLGLREELPAFTGIWEQCGSMFASSATPPGPCEQEFSGATTDEFKRRLVVAESDLETEIAAYWMEAWYIVRDDADIFNSIAHVPVSPVFSDLTWSFNPGATIQGAAIDEWLAPDVSDPDKQHVRISSASGHYDLAVKTTDLGAGLFRYVYVLMNFDFDPQFNAFSLVQPPGLVVSNMIFSDADGDALNDWVGTAGGGQIRWQAPVGVALDWGHAATFSFEIDAQPVAGKVTLSRAESPEEIAVSILVIENTDRIFLDGLEDPAP